MADPQPAAVRAVVSPAADTRPPAPEGFEEFFRASFRQLVKTAMIWGATAEEAEDAASRTLAEMLPAWEAGKYSLAFARKAVVHNFIKEKTRGIRRVAQRLIDRGHVPHLEGVEDGRLHEWEDEQWVNDILSELPKAQREVMECIAKGMERDEIAEKLGMSRDAVRRNICDARPRLARLLHPDGEHRSLSRTAASSSREEGR